MTRGLCSGCGRDMKVRHDGMVILHHHLGAACEGSGLPPLGSHVHACRHCEARWDEEMT